MPDQNCAILDVSPPFLKIKGNSFAQELLVFYVSLVNKAYPTFDEELKTIPFTIPLGAC